MKRMFNIVSLAVLCLMFSAMTLHWSTAHAEEKPSTSDILTWIGGHFEVGNEDEKSPQLYFHHEHSYGLSFKDCQVAVTEVNDVTLVYPDGHREYAPYLKHTYVYGPLDLSNFRPDKIAVDEKLWITLRAVNPIPFSDTYCIDPKHPEETTTSRGELKGLNIRFSTREMASRHAQAWHDAITGCGGKAIPDNLY
jgi:hypothetical protein